MTKKREEGAAGGSGRGWSEIREREGMGLYTKVKYVGPTASLSDITSKLMIGASDQRAARDES